MRHNPKMAQHRTSLSDMKFELKALYRNGIVLLAEELAAAPRHVGTLIVEDFPPEGVFGRSVRNARLLDTNKSQTPRDITPPLFDAQLAKVLENQMVLHGYEIHQNMKTNVINHHVQVWILCLVPDE
jgi:hypothetical protein